MEFYGYIVDVKPWFDFGEDEIHSKDTKKFRMVQNEFCINDPIANWWIEDVDHNPGSTIGSTITLDPDNPTTKAIYTAGINTTTGNIQEWLYVKDTNNCCDSDCPTDSNRHRTSALSAIKVKPCRVILKPTDDPVTIGADGTIRFSIPVYNCCFEEPNYTWELSVDAGIGSTISANGKYRAGRDLIPDPECTTRQETVKLTAYCSDPSNTIEIEKNVTIKAVKVTISSDPDPFPTLLNQDISLISVLPLSAMIMILVTAGL